MRTPPADLAAERATLGALMLERDAIIAVAAWLSDQHFYLEKHARIYAAILACYHRRVPPDLATIADELRRSERLDQIGGIGYLGELSAEVPTAVHVEYYARIVERTALFRQLIVAGGKIAALGYAETPDVDEVLADAESVLRTVTHSRAVGDFVHVSHVAESFLERLSVLQHEDRAVVGAATGFADLDALLGGLQPADLIIVAARPSVGKTSFALSMAHALLREQHHVAVFSLEMSREQLLQRLLAMETGIDVQVLRTGRVYGEDLNRTIHAMGGVAEFPLSIDDMPGQSIQQIRAKAARLHSEHPIAAVIVDYIGLVAGSRYRDNRVQEIGEISRGLKGLARELNVPVIALSQLSRAVEGRARHVPILSDLRESGDVEQDADVVMFIYREELYDKETDKKGVAEIHIAKHRNGPLGVVPLRFAAHTTQFQTLERYRVPDGYAS